MAQYPRFQDSEFIKLQQQNTERGNYIDGLTDKINYISTAINTTNNCIKSLKNEQQHNGINKVISIRQNLLMEMNKDAPDLEKIEFYANQIYEAIIGQDISSESAQIKDYYNFRNAVSQYKAFQALKSDIENTLKSLKVSRIDFTLNNANTDNKIALSAWKSNWHNILNELKNIIRSCPLPNELILTSDTSDESEPTKPNQSAMQTYDDFKREKLITSISEIEHAYLTDLNIIEKSLHLLSSKYKYMAWFSFAAAILLDLLGALMGIALHWFFIAQCHQCVEPHSAYPVGICCEKNILHHAGRVLASILISLII